MQSDQVRDVLQKVRRLEIKTRSMVSDALSGRYHSVFRGRGMEFDEVREYVPGDEVRTIDWNVTARAGRPFVKKFVEERELTILLLVDASASGGFGSLEKSKREVAAELASLLALSAVRNGDKVGLVLFTDSVEKFIPPKKGNKHVQRVVREILFHEPRHRATDIARALDFANQVISRRAVVFLISDFLLNGDEGTALRALQKGLRLGRKRHDLIAVQVLDRRELELPDVGQLSLEDAETEEVMSVNTADPQVRRRFAEIAQARLERLRKVLRQEKVDRLDVDTEHPYLPALMKFFEKRERRQR